MLISYREDCDWGETLGARLWRVLRGISSSLCGLPGGRNLGALSGRAALLSLPSDPAQLMAAGAVEQAQKAHGRRPEINENQPVEEWTDGERNSPQFGGVGLREEPIWGEEPFPTVSVPLLQARL